MPSPKNFAGPDAKVLITGGSRGIGRGLARRFHASGATVMITGRDERELRNAEAELPGLLTFTNDMSDPASRERLADHVGDHLPDVNVVINNAGIQRRVSLAMDDASWSERSQEIDILLSGPIHLNSLLIPIILWNGRSSLIVNVSSGGAFVPQPFAPIYAACKAAIHSYTMTLRDALSDTPCRVVELIPPAVATGLAGPGDNHGASPDVFCDEIFPQIVVATAEEIGFGATTSDDFQSAMAPYQAMFKAAAERAPVKRYGL